MRQNLTVTTESQNPECHVSHHESAHEGAHECQDFLANLHDELLQGPLNLPCFPDIVPRIRKALDDPDSTADDIVKVVSAEPRLSARLIQTAGASVFNPSGSPPPHLKAAVFRLGRHLVQSVTMAFMLQQMKSEPMLRKVSDPLNELWTKSMAVASICKLIAQRLKVPADKVFLTGLMHGIGHFYILVRSAMPDSTIQYAQLRQDLVAQRHPSLGQAVLRKWGFEDIISNAVAQQHDVQRQSSRAADIVDVLTASVVMAEAMMYLESDLSRTEEVSAFERLDISSTDLQAMLTHTEHTLGSLNDALMS